MKVLLIPEQFPTTAHEAAGIFMRDYAKAIAQFARCEIFYTCAFKTGDPLDADRELNLKTYFYQTFRPTGLSRMPKYYFWEKAAISFAKLNIEKPDILHLHGAALRGNIAARLAQYWKIPLVVTEHTGPWSAIADRVMVLRRVKQTISRADTLLPVSRHLLAEMQQSGISHPHTHVLGNPIDTGFFTTGPALAERPPNFLFLGRFDEFKGALRVLKAFAAVQPQISDWTLTLAGEGEEKEEIQQFITTHNLQHSVRLLPFQSRQGMRQLLHQSRCLLFPSRFESFGMVAAEALSTGTPLIITNQTGPVDYFTDSCGYAIPPDEVAAIAQAMQKMAAQYAAFQPQALHSHVQQHFGIQAFAKKLEDVFRQTQKSAN